MPPPTTSYILFNSDLDLAVRVRHSSLVSSVISSTACTIRSRLHDVLVLDMAKAFDKVGHRRLLKKLEYYGIRGPTNIWINSFLSKRSQTVVFEGSSSYTAPVKSGVPQGSVLGPCMFLFFMNDLPDALTSQVRLFADDTLVYLTVNSQDDANRLQADLNKLAEWGQRWLMEFNAKKCQVLRVTRRRHILEHQYTLHGKNICQIPWCYYIF